jgi:hypothetical protein
MSLRSLSDSARSDGGEPDQWWCCHDSAYEVRKSAVTVACLPRMRYCSAFEAGGSVGILTELLAVRCDRLVSSDITPPAPYAAGALVGIDGDAVREDCAIRQQWPSGQFDLVVFNEFAFRLDERALGRVAACVSESTELAAHVVGVHSRSEANGPVSAERSHEIIAATPGLITVVHHIDEEFVLDIWERC